MSLEGSVPTMVAGYEPPPEKPTRMPLDPATTQNGRGPVVVAEPESAQAQRFVALANAVRDVLYEEPI